MQHDKNSADAEQEDDFEYVVQALQDTEQRRYALRALAKIPLSDERIIPHLQELLTDTTPAIIEIPFVYGELRWLAARALYLEYKASGIDTTVELREVPKPLDSSELGKLLQEEIIRGNPIGPDLLDEFAALRAMGRIPIVDLILFTQAKK